ncbi:hypothetical protein ADEAN_000820400 [Angomonas deanei]|uniref:Uncharacterized protein n=1 Tax=Angomonas deanei TaxID=59799 RepID=A0A7G2CR70_9TRYP|nr:hypothetical protein ADEAN_000820400 [Angomonas deanei]
MFGGNAAQNNINNNNTRTGSILNPTSSLLPAATTALTTEVSADKMAKDRPTVLIVGTTPNAFYMYWVFQQCGFDVKAVAHVTSEGCRVPPPLTGNNKGNADNLTQFYKNTREAKKTSMDKSAMREAELFIKGCIDVYDLPKLKTAEEYQQERKEEANKLKELEEKLKNIQTNNNNNNRILRQQGSIRIYSVRHPIIIIIRLVQDLLWAVQPMR